MCKGPFLAGTLRDPKMDPWVSLPSMFLEFHILGTSDMDINNYNTSSKMENVLREVPKMVQRTEKLF